MKEKYFLQIKLKEKHIKKEGLDKIFSKLKEVTNSEPITDKNIHDFNNFDSMSLKPSVENTDEGKEFYYMVDVTKYVIDNNLNKDSAFRYLDRDIYCIIGKKVIHAMHHVTAADSHVSWSMVRTILPNTNLYHSLGLN